MQIEFLGSGGAITTPKPGCDCRVCAEARERGVPYSRAGPSIFVHGPNVLIDTPEEIKAQLNRSRVPAVTACFYSHWHPDHTMGRRVWEMNNDWRGWPRDNRCTDIYMPERVARDFRERLATWEHLTFLAEHGLVRLIEVGEDEEVKIRGYTVLPIALAESYAYGFLIAGAAAGPHPDGSVRALIVPDEIIGWEPPAHVIGVDLAVIPMGVVEFDPFTKSRRIPEDHPVLSTEATFRETLEIARKLDAGHVIMTHIEEPDGLTYDDLKRLEERDELRGSTVTFAYDTLTVAV